jgi:hypothetical protein
LFGLLAVAIFVLTGVPNAIAVPVTVTVDVAVAVSSRKAIGLPGLVYAWHCDHAHLGQGHAAGAWSKLMITVIGPRGAFITKRIWVSH